MNREAKPSGEKTGTGVVVFFLKTFGIPQLLMISLGDGLKQWEIGFL